jgi:hypothetical protein
MTYYITADSFGADLPENWGQIADFLNSLIHEQGIENDRAAVNDLWDDFWSGKIQMP